MPRVVSVVSVGVAGAEDPEAGAGATTSRRAGERSNRGLDARLSRCARTSSSAWKLSAKDEGGHLRDHLYPWLGHRPIREVTKAEMLTWVRALPLHDRSDGRPGKISGRTCHNIANTVRHAFKHAAKEDVIEVSPCVWDFTDLPDKEGSKDRLTGAASPSRRSPL